MQKVLADDMCTVAQASDAHMIGGSSSPNDVVATAIQSADCESAAQPISQGVPLHSYEAQEM